MKRMILSLTLAAALCLSLVPGAGAAFTDIPDDTTQVAAATLQGLGVVSGASGATFSPNETLTRAQMCAMAVNAMGLSDQVSTGGRKTLFSDVSPSAWYNGYVNTAYGEGLVNGYGNGTFGPDDPVTREQIAAIFWRYEGSPDSETGAGFADEEDISDYAAEAVDWARANGIVNGMEGNYFLPQDSATRAQVATLLQNYLTMEGTGEPDAPAEESRVLVAYFSATGNTERVANAIAEAAGGDLFEITPAEPYTDDDLDWTDEGSRVVFEYENPEERDTELVTYTPEGWDDYDVVFIGYPIWWYDAAWPVDGFVAENDFTGKTVIPFCTSSSSGLGESGQRLAELAGTGNWQEGQRFRGSASQEDVAAWVESLNLTSSN